MKGLWQTKLDFIEGGKHSYRDRRKKVTKKQFIKDNFKHYIKFRVEPEIKEAIIFNYEAIVQYRANVVDCINYFNNKLTVYKTKKICFRTFESSRDKVIKSLYDYMKPVSGDLLILSLNKVKEDIYKRKTLHYIPNFDFSYVFTQSEKIKRKINSCKRKKKFKISENRGYRRIFKEKISILQEQYEEVKYRKKYRMSSLKKISRLTKRIYQY